jgi:SAM-dependent methyltransferase
MNPFKNLYREDLAYIHDVGHGALAEAAAQRLVEELRAQGLHGGVVIDLGCGSGILAERLTRAGYSVVGFDISEAMIAIARKRVPEADFRVDSFVTAELPACIAVTAIGEVLNYAGDSQNFPQEQDHLFRRVHDALEPDGFFLFDVAANERATSAGTKTFAEGADWAVLSQAELGESPRVLIRRITTFRQVGTLYRRDTETHNLLLVDADNMRQALGSVGFEVRRLESYGAPRFPVGLVGFLSRKIIE